MSATELHAKRYTDLYTRAAEVLKEYPRFKHVTVRGVAMEYQPALHATQVGGRGAQEVEMRSEGMYLFLTSYGERRANKNV